jgi:hypothetical protein
MARIGEADDLPRCSTITPCVLHSVAVVLEFTGAHLGAKFTSGRGDVKISREWMVLMVRVGDGAGKG